VPTFSRHENVVDGSGSPLSIHLFVMLQLDGLSIAPLSPPL